MTRLSLLVVGLTLGWLANSASAQAPAANPQAESSNRSASGTNRPFDAATDSDADPDKPAAKVEQPVEPAPGQIQRLSKQGPLVLDPELELLDPRVYRVRIGLKIEAPDGAAKQVVAMCPVPIDWPEQRLRLLSEKISPSVRATETLIKNQCGMVKLQVEVIPKGGTVVWERLYEITRYRLNFKLPATELKYAKAPPSELREQLTKPAPGLEMQHTKIIDLAKKLGHEGKSDEPWDEVKHYWQWVRDNVKFQNGDFRGALFAVEQKCGDCEEMSALFISVCRLNGAVARTVWVEGHNFPEFYMLDAKGTGHWIPAQVVGPAWFGEMVEYRPIFQKGDRFFDPFRKEYVRYAPQTARADGGGSPPKLTVIHDIIADSDINGPTYDNPAPR
ncbi:MAG: hypothetical protein JSS27_08600 [Planctomycetes bacterium]|nr:hypothetical protein [Planctomycetota bacterium]